VRYKVVPDPLGLDTLETVHEALPLVPDSVEDCCLRVVDRTAVPARDDAREWITFCQALGLAERTDGRYRRVRTAFGPDALAGAYREGVFGVAELLDALDAEGPLTADTAFERLAPAIPEWERDRHTDWEREWRERTRRLLAWASLFGLVTRDGERYALADNSE
jgi:hypothetical protein